MLFGALFGGILGAFIPDSFRATLQMLMRDVLTQGKFEIAVMLSFLVSLVSTIVGAWIDGRNLKPHDLNKAA